MVKKSAFLICYGGSHARIITNMCRELLSRGYIVNCLALNSGRALLDSFKASFETSHFPGMDSEDFNVFGVSELIDRINRLSDEQVFDINEIENAYRVANAIHPMREHAVSPEETTSYIGVSMLGLIKDMGYEKACKAYLEKGRQAFLPIEFARSTLEFFKPTIIFVTNAPRMERAFCISAKKMSLLTVGICDFFGNSEIAPLEASKICVINEFTRKKLIQKGYSPNRIYVTGQPGMDDTAQIKTKKQGPGKIFSKSFNYRLLLAAQPGKKGFETTLGIIDELGSIEEQFSNLKVRITMHPSSSGVERKKIKREAEKYGFMICSGTSRKQFFWADTVVSGFSTTLLEAAHAGLRPISVQNTLDPHEVDPDIISICNSGKLLEELDRPFVPCKKNLPYSGSASQRVADMAEKWM